MSKVTRDVATEAFFWREWVSQAQPILYKSFVRFVMSRTELRASFYPLVAGYCECGYEPSGSTKCGEFLVYMRTCYFLKDTVTCS
jgi:hypothetical protein